MAASLVRFRARRILGRQARDLNHGSTASGARRPDRREWASPVPPSCPVATTARPEVSLPPGPRLPRWIQTAGFLLFPRRFFDACRRRYGDAVTFSTAFDSRFVMVFEPELVKQVFQGSNAQLHAGEANSLLGPVLG
jgi:hypothetical protein